MLTRIRWLIHSNKFVEADHLAKTPLEREYVSAHAEQEGVLLPPYMEDFIVGNGWGNGRPVYGNSHDEGYGFGFGRREQWDTGPWAHRHGFLGLDGPEIWKLCRPFPRSE